MNNVMVDLETLATTADAVILSIGAVVFDLKTGEMSTDGFYRVVSVESSLAQGRRVSESTLKFWMSQGDDAKSVFSEPSVPIDFALSEFAVWLPKDPIMWSNGADFDLPMLAHAYTQLGDAVPWKYWNSRCFRTYKNLPGAKEIRVPFEGIKHNALADAMHQVQTLAAIHHKLFNEGAV